MIGLRPADIGQCSLGQWQALVNSWQKAHQQQPDAPTDTEFEAAVAAARRRSR